MSDNLYNFILKRSLRDKCASKNIKSYDNNDDNNSISNSYNSLTIKDNEKNKNLNRTNTIEIKPQVVVFQERHLSKEQQCINRAIELSYKKSYPNSCNDDNLIEYIKVKSLIEYKKTHGNEEKIITFVKLRSQTDK